MSIVTASKTPAEGRLCRVCGTDGVAVALDLGTAAACVHFPESPGQFVQRIPFRLGACGNCGLIQLADTPDLEWLQPPGQSVPFRESDRHLDDLCAVMFSQIPQRNGLVLGLTYNDAPILDRFRAAGFTRTVVLNRADDWQLRSPREGIETMQQRVTPDWAGRIRDRHGPAEFLCVRYLLEHAQDVAAFLAGCQTLLAPDGWVLFETPGCETELARGDAGALWEEHVQYFTPTSLRRGLAHHGFRCRWVGNYPYAVEDCLAAFGQFSEVTDREMTTTDAGHSLLREFSSARQRLRLRLEEYADRVTARGQKIAMWGAGHRAATLVELLPARNLIACVIDDAPEKQGRFLPGSDLPILSSEALNTQAIGVCICLLNPDVMQRIAARHPEFTARGGRFLTLNDVADSDGKEEL